MRILIALIAGVLFGAGLAFSGMADPARVQAFLDLGGNWDPTLAFVMGGAMLPMAVAWAVKRAMKAPIAAPAFEVPSNRTLDKPLAIGAILFGIGWGIAGLCPGPAVANLGLVPMSVLPFIIAMLIGMAAHRFIPVSTK